MTRTMHQVRPLRGFSGEEAADPFLAVLRHGPKLIQEGRQVAWGEGVSYRNFLVGTSVLGILGGEAVMVAGANWKPDPTTPKKCAEPTALQKTAEFSEVLALCVVGSTDRTEIKGVTGFDMPTLPSCPSCTCHLSEHPLISPNTPVLTAGLDTDIAELHTVGGFQAVYEGLVAPPFPDVVADPGFSAWDQRVGQYQELLDAGLFPLAAARSVITDYAG